MPRGRNAETPAGIPAQGWKDIAVRVKDEVSEDRVGLIAAGIAFYGLLALFPAIGALIAIAGLVVDPAEVVAQIDSLRGFMPEEVLTIISAQATDVAGTGGGGLGLAAVFGLLLALYSASKGMASLMQGINVAYDEEEARGFVRLKLVTFALTLFLMLGLLIALMAMLGLPALLVFFDPGARVAWIASAALGLCLLVLTILGLSVIYRYGPSRDAPEWKWVSGGAVAGCLAWLLASAGFAFYVRNFGSYNESFGAVAGVIVLLLWFWISAFIILLGAELNAEMEAQTRHDTTRGRDRQMGHRDAVKADTLGQAATE